VGNRITRESKRDCPAHEGDSAASKEGSIVAKKVRKPWYAPWEIHFTHRTALWLIHNLGALRAGQWPADASNYRDIAKIRKKGGGVAPFITPVEFATEITMRLEKCREDGLILLAMECWGESEYSLARYFRSSAWSIRKRRKNALRYVASGPDVRWHDTKKRKGETYSEFITPEHKS